MTIEEYIDGMKRYFSTTSKPNGRHSVDDCCNFITFYVLRVYSTSIVQLES